MRKTLVALAGAAAALTVSAPASAASILFDITAPTGTFVSNPVSCDAGPGNCAGNFTATGSFMAPSGYSLVAASITTTGIIAANDINFASAMLNGTPFSLSPTGMFEFGDVGPISLMETNTLVVTGFTGGSASFTGDLAFADAVPEPAAWALMMLGFAGIGSMIRRRKNTEVRARLQMA